MPKKRVKNKKIDIDHFRVAIFGSARSQKNDAAYKLVYKLAKMLAQKDIDIVTGGGPGLMDAASRGHHAGRKNDDVHSVGLTIKLPHEQKDSYHLDVREEFHRFSNRLDEFMELSNAVVVAPGGLGTLLELMYTWQLAQVKQICHIPIILLGDMWEPLTDWIRKVMVRRKLVSKGDLDLVYHAKNCTQVMEIITRAHEHFKQGGKEFCVNYHKYAAIKSKKTS